MSVEITTDAQGSEVSSPLIFLYEISLGTGTNNTLFFHSAKDLDGTDSNKDLIFDGNTYISLPIIIDDIEKKADGAMNRPKVTIANVETLIKTGSAFKTEMEDGTWDSAIQGENITATNFKFEDLIGQRFVRRKTLEKYTGSATPVEFPKETFIIDRISEKNFLSVTLELASPMDLNGVRIPARTVVGKYCPWIYKGHNVSETKSACYWLDHEQISDTSNNKYSFYFTKNDEPLILYDHFFNADGTRKSAESGSIARVEIRTGGSGYSSAPSVTISAPTSGTTATATATISSGSVNAITVTNAGSGYTGEATVSFSGGSPTAAATAVARINFAAWMGDYSSSTAYLKGQYVYSNALVWRAEQDVTNVTPAEGNSNWQIVRTYKTWDSSTSYTINSSDPRQNSYVRFLDSGDASNPNNNKVFRAIKANTNVEPGTDSTTWVAGDACGKLLKSCKIRYQALPRKVGTTAVQTDAIPHSENNTNIWLPFGGFPGSRKFR